MPELNAGQTYTAIAPITNPTDWSFNYTAELYLGLPKAASSGIKTFTLGPGVSQNISFPVTMPADEGVFPVYLDILVDGELVAGFVAEPVTTVIVPAVEIGPIIWE